MVILSVDPGNKGAFATHRQDHVAVEDLPLMTYGKTGREMLNAPALADRLRVLMAWARLTWQDDGHLFCEQINAPPEIKGKGGVVYKTGVSTGFSMGRALGAIEGIAAGLALPLTLIHPRTWKAYYKLGNDKEESRAMAIRLYPRLADHLNLKKHEGRAEALLIGRYARYLGIGGPTPPRPF